MPKNNTYHTAFTGRLPVRLLVVFLLCCSSGYILWSSARTICYHYVRMHKASISLRDTITMPAADFKSNKDFVWMKHDEICYKGKMFDVKKQIRQGDDVLLAGHYDNLENKLFKLLNRWLDDHNDSEKPEKAYAKWIPDAVINQNIPTITFPKILKEKKIQPSDCCVCSRSLKPPFHPPRIA